jgi:hypothetical protein
MITKQIDGKTVSFWLDGEFVRASVGDRVIGDVAVSVSIPGRSDCWSRARDWELFSAAVLDPIPSQSSPDETGGIKANLFYVVIAAGNELRKEAA